MALIDCTLNNIEQTGANSRIDFNNSEAIFIFY